MIKKLSIVATEGTSGNTFELSNHVRKSKKFCHAGLFVKVSWGVPEATSLFFHFNTLRDLFVVPSVNIQAQCCKLVINDIGLNRCSLIPALVWGQAWDVNSTTWVSLQRRVLAHAFLVPWGIVAQVELYWRIRGNMVDYCGSFRSQQLFHVSFQHQPCKPDI